ncbi:MAG: M48 family metalloprotease [Planctomycetes bacterium]|nr:M48 family metalloprotease [Planctomycetota bacterium]
MNNNRTKYMALGAIALAGLLAGCQFFGKLAGAEIIEEYTPDNEYYMGRGVSATIVAKFPSADLKEDPVRKDLEYLNSMGGYLYQASRNIDRSNLGDHVGRGDKDNERIQNLVLQNGITVGILDTEEVMAFSLPGGFMWFSRGMISLCKDEDELAAVMCHEMGHLVMNHASDAFRDAQNNAASTAAISKKFKNKLTASFVAGMGGFFNDLAEKGYAKDLEYEADNFGARALAAAGYDPNSLVAILKRVDEYEHAHGEHGKYLDNHPPIEERVETLQKLLKNPKNGIQVGNFKAGYNARLARFKEFMGK